MPPAAARTAVCSLLLCGAGALWGQSAPTRPGALPPAERETWPARVAAGRLAAQLGLRLEAGREGPAFDLVGGGHRVRLEPGSREATIDGLRFYLGDPVEVREGRCYLSRADCEGHLLPLLRPGWIRPRPPVPRVVALDPGHGGVDHGAENRRLGLMEKTFTLDVAFRLRRLLEARGYRVILTRDSDRKIELAQRSEIANLAGADLFVSIHFNSLPGDTRTEGTEVYTFPCVSQRSSQAWGAGAASDAEDRASPVNRFDPWSTLLAACVHREALARLHTYDRGQKLKHLGVLRGLNCPGMLIESAFLSNDAEARRVADPAFREQVARAVAAGIEDYARETASPSTSLRSGE